MWTGAAVAYQQGKEVGSKATPVGLNASHKDASFQAMMDAVELAKTALAGAPARTVNILTADHQIIPWLLNTDKHGNAAACRSICESLAFTLFDHPGTMVTISWIPGSIGFLPLKLILETASNAAATIDLTEQQPPPTIAALQHEAKLKALADWEEIWLKDLRRNPAYRALHHPPSGQPPEFTSGIESFARPVFCTALRMLTEHAFTGEYNTRHRPRAPDPHDCPCGLTPLQTVDHLLLECPLFKEARERFLRPAAPTLSTAILFGTKAGGNALAKFIEVTQVCVRPRRQTPEDHS